MKKIDFISFNNAYIDYCNIEVALLKQINNIFKILCEHIELSEHDVLFVRKWYLYNEDNSPISFINEDGNVVVIYFLFLNENNELCFYSSFGILDIDEVSFCFGFLISPIVIATIDLGLYCCNCRHVSSSVTPVE